MSSFSLAGSVGGVAHNNGVEGRWPSFTQAVCGSAGKSSKIKVDVFVKADNGWDGHKIRKGGHESKIGDIKKFSGGL